MPIAKNPSAPRPDTLALLYQNILTSIVRIQSAKQPLTNLETFRAKMEKLLEETERAAKKAGYGAAEVKEAEFAVVAFLDEAILSVKSLKLEEWRKRPLNIQLFGQAVAGDVFFDKLAEIEPRRDSPRLADLLEVYLLCLLLGFEGRYAPPLNAEAHRITDRLRQRIESIRNTDYKLSPPLEFGPGVEVPAPADKWLWWLGGGLATVALLFVVYHWDLSGGIGQLKSAVDGLR